MAKKYISHPDLIENTFGELRLKVLHFFHVDYGLQKYKELAKKKVNLDLNVNQGGAMTERAMTDSETEAEGIRMDLESVSVVAQDAEYRKEKYDSNRGSYERDAVQRAEHDAKTPWWKRLVNKFNERVHTISVEDTFDYIKEAKKELEEADRFKSINDQLTSAIEYAKLCGQKNLALTIMDQRQIVVYEGTLVKNGFKYYVNEQDVIEFMKKANRGVAVDYIRYYSGFIPEDVAKKKAKADSLCIFDNYCIIYFDNNRNILKLNEEQVRRAKDPILFGMIKNSRRLYFIADWITADDDLTLDKFYEILGNPALKEQQELVELSSANLENLINNIVIVDHIDRSQEWVGDEDEVTEGSSDDI
jgi:hypothetical protein